MSHYYIEKFAEFRYFVFDDRCDCETDAIGPYKTREEADAAVAQFEAEDDPTPYCSYGHKSAAACDCGPIAANE